MISHLCLISSISTSQMASLKSNSGVVNPTNGLENDSKQDDKTYFHTQWHMQKCSASPQSRTTISIFTSKATGRNKHLYMSLYQ